MRQGTVSSHFIDGRAKAHKVKKLVPINYLVNDGTRIESELHVTPKTLLLNTLLHFSKKPFVDFKILFI